ncbi:MAG: rhodanese-like domain-containing protein [Cytophagales bacterium]|nr:rhodanese-like domain-containing protein [Cytophagales bacterium]
MKYPVILFLAFACSTAPEQDVQKISNAELVELMKNPDVQLVDIRTPDEVAEGFIKGARKIDFYSNDFLTQMDELDKDKPLAIYCRSGGRSGKAVAKLSTFGFKKIYDISGGFSGWQAGGYPIANR